MVKILVIPTKKYLKPDRYGFFGKKLSIIDTIEKHGLWIERDLAEKDPNYLQIIPYVICANQDSIFTYQRLKKGTEERLHSKYSVGIGGHIDMTLDILTSSKESIIEKSMIKELKEELSPINGAFPTDLGKVIYDPSNEVGKVHLGLLYIEHVFPNVQSNEPDKISGRLMPIKEISDLYKKDPDSFETWSVIALKHIGVL